MSQAREQGLYPICFPQELHAKMHTLENEPTEPRDQQASRAAIQKHRRRKAAADVRCSCCSEERGGVHRVRSGSGSQGTLCYLQERRSGSLKSL